MIQESDSLEDGFLAHILGDPSTTNANDRKPGKFCPKPRAKTSKQAGESLVPTAPANQGRTDIDCGVDFLDGDVQNASTTARAGRFQPKPKPKPRDKTLATCSNVEIGVTKSVDVSVPDSSHSVLEANVTPDDTVVQTDAILQVEPSTSTAEAATTFESIEVFVDIFAQPSATSEQTMGKFQPKRVPRPKERKAKSVTFDLPTAPALETQSEVLPFTSTGAEPLTEIISGGVLDETQQSLSVVPACADFQLDHGRLLEEEAAEISGLESLGDSPVESILTPDQSVSKFQPKLVGKPKDTESDISIPSCGSEGCSLQSDSCDMGNEALEGHDLVYEGDTAMWTNDSMTTGLEQQHEDLFEMSKVKAASSGSNQVLHSMHTPLERENTEDQTQEVIDETGTVAVQNHRGSRILKKRRKRNDATTSGKLDASEDWDVENTEDQTQQVIDETGTVAVQNPRGSRILKKRRKRNDATTSGKLDASEDWDVENSNISQMDEDHNNDDYRDEDMHMQNKVSRKSKRQTTEKQKTVRRRKKTPEETGSSKKEPPKKRFPHGTRRRRKVDKELLEKPGEELTIRDLIIIAEAKERTSSKEAATLGTDQSNIGSHFNDEYGYNPEMDQDLDDEAAHRQMLRNSTKLNYHTFMDKPKSVRWSKSETEQLYEAIRHFGTDFAMIQQLSFPSRTRHQVKLKYKNEERKHPLQVSDALKNPSKDHSYFERLIRQLRAQAEKSRQEADDYYASTSEAAAVVNEEGRGKPEKQVQEANTFEGNVDSAKCEDWDEDDQNTSNQDWDDQNTSNQDWDEDDANDWEADPSSEKLSEQEANGYPATVSQDAANENKEEGGDPEKEVQEVNGFEDEDWNEDDQDAADDNGEDWL